MRSSSDDSIIVILNFGNKFERVMIQGLKDYPYLFSISNTKGEDDVNSDLLKIEPLGGYIFRKRKQDAK